MRSISRRGWALFSWAICGLHREFDKAAACVIETGKWDAEIWQVLTADLSISKTVTGHFGDASKAFEFRLSAMGPNGESLHGQTFAVSVAYRISEIEDKNYATSAHVNGQLTPAKPEYGATVQDVVLQSMGDAVECINDCTIEPPATGIDMESSTWMTMLFLSALMGILLSLIRRMRQQ